MILVIADDFSGAAEIAGAAHQFGLTAEVQTDQLSESDCDVVVVDANTRSLSPELAAAAMKRLASSIRRAKPRWLFKKVDSVLRGSILAELNALTESLGMSSCLLINANPRKGRLVRGGELIIDGQPIHMTAFARDPEHPRTSSSVTALLGSDAVGIQLVDRAEQVDEPDSGQRVCVANIESSEDLAQYAERRNRSCLLAGGAEFFESLLSSEFGHSGNRSDSNLSLNPATLIIRGTSIRHGDEDLHGATSDEIVCADLNLEATIEEACRQLTAQSFAIVAADRDRNERPADCLSLTPEQLHRQLVEVVVGVCGRCKPHQLWIEGGRTASGLVRASGWDRLRVQHVYSDGVVGLRPLDPNAPSLVVKPGSYRWPVSWRTQPRSGPHSPARYGA